MAQQGKTAAKKKAAVKKAAPRKPRQAPSKPKKPGRPKRDPESRKLSIKEQGFVLAYVETSGNATEAARRAGYKGAVNRIGHELVNKPHIKRAIREATQPAFDSLNLTNEMIIAGLHSEALYHGPNATHGARVAAWTALAKIRGMNKADTGADGGPPRQIVDYRIRFIGPGQAAH